MTADYDILRLKEEVRDLRDIITGMERSQAVSSNPRLVKIGKRLSNDEGFFADFHVVSGNLDKRTDAPSIAAQKLDDDHHILVWNGGQWFFKDCCGSSAGDPTNCSSVQSGLLPELLTLDITGVPYTNEDNRTGWTAAAEALINAGHPAVQNPSTGYEVFTGDQVSPPSVIVTNDCSRAGIKYYPMPEIPNGFVPLRPYNAMRLMYEIKATVGITLEYSWYAYVYVSFGHMIGDPMDETGNGYFYNAQAVGPGLSFQQRVSFNSTPQVQKLSPTGDTVVNANEAGGGLNPTDPRNFDFADFVAVVEVQPGPLPAPPNPTTVDTVANLPLASIYQLGDTITVYNDGANNGVYVATGAAYPPTAWVKS